MDFRASYASYTQSGSTPRDAAAMLEAARQKLFSENTPKLLRIVGFLRLSCLAMPAPGQCSKLMQELTQLDDLWWNTCDITTAELLKSSDLQVNQLLQPIIELHQTHERVPSVVHSFLFSHRPSA